MDCKLRAVEIRQFFKAALNQFQSNDNLRSIRRQNILVPLHRHLVSLFYGPIGILGIADDSDRAAVEAEQAPGLFLVGTDPVAGYIAGDEKGKARPCRCSDDGIDNPPDGTKEDPSGDGQRGRPGRKSEGARV